MPALLTPRNPTPSLADMNNYNELCKLANSQQYRSMFLP